MAKSVAVEYIEGVTQSGFNFKVDPEVVKDMAFVELAAAAQKNPVKYPEFIGFILGEAQKEKLYEHVKKDNGRIPLDDVNTELKEILEKVNQAEETKN